MSGVVRAPDGALVAGATVTATQHDEIDGEALRESTNSDDDGRFVIDRLRLGVRYDLACKVDGFESPAPVEPVTTTPDAPEAVRDLVLRRPASMLVVVLGADGTVTPSARVGCFRAHSDVFDRCVNVEAGQDGARIDRLDPGPLTVHAWSDDSADTSADVTLAEGDTTRVAITLLPALAIDLVVVDDAGAPLAGASARTEEEFAGGRRERRSATSGANGALRLPARTARPRPIVVGADAHVGTKLNATPGSALVRVVLQRTAQMRFAFRTPAKVAAADCRWRALDENGVAITGGIVSSDNDAPTGVVVVPLAARQLQLHVDNYRDAIVAVRPVLGETTDLGEIALDRGAGVVGRVPGCSGGQQDATDVEVLDVGGEHVLGGADLGSDGAFAVYGLASGPVRIHVSIAEFADALVTAEAATDPKPVTIAMRHGCLLKVRAIEADGLPALGVHVDALAPDGTAAPGWFMRQIHPGTLEQRLPPGRWRIVATRGDLRAEETVDAAEGATLGLALRLSR